MRAHLSYALEGLLDMSASLGVGMADSSGLLLQAHGAHGGHDPTRIAAHLVGAGPEPFDALLGDALPERLLVGERLILVQRWFQSGRFFLFLVAPREADVGRLRRELRRRIESLEPLFERAGLLVPTRESLHQFAQVAGSPLIR